MSLKTRKEAGWNQLDAALPAANSSASVDRNERSTQQKPTFEPGMSLDPNDLTDGPTATLLDRSRKMGMPPMFFDWVEREMLQNPSVPTRNVIENR
jgi:hypothetical protein